MAKNRMQIHGHEGQFWLTTWPIIIAFGWDQLHLIGNIKIHILSNCHLLKCEYHVQKTSLNNFYFFC